MTRLKNETAMMYNVKSSHTPSKKHQDKNVHNVKNSFINKTGDKNDNVEKMVLKNIKSNMNSPESALTLDPKLTEYSNFLTNQMHSIDKNSDKRSDEKVSHSPQKKLKTDNSEHTSEQSSESLPPKKTNKFKSMFPKTYICKYCCRRFLSVDQLRQHTNAEHANKPSHVCHLCSHQTASFSALMTHYLKHSGNKRDNVDKIYAKSKADFSNLQLNMFSRPKSSVQCDKCNLNFSSKTKYDAHNCTNIPPKSEYNCAYCRHVSTTVEDYRNHIQSHSETPFTCPYCNHKAMTKKQFDSHRGSCKLRLKKTLNHKCDKCNVFASKSKKELKNHLKNCEANTPQICTKCFKEFKEEKSYKEHVLICDKNDDPVNLKCDNCNVFSSKSKKELNNHIKNCRANTSQICTKCKIEFKEEKSYEEHILICNKNEDPVIKINKNNNNNQKSTKKVFKRKRKVKESALDKNKLLCCVCDHVCYSKSEHEDHERQCLAEMANISSTSSNKITTSVCSVCGETVDESKLVEHIKICNSKNEIKLEKNPLSDDPQNTRRSRRVSRRKSSFTDDDEEVKKTKPIKIKIPRKPKIPKIPKLLMKPKFRKGRQSKNANNPFLCNYCDFTFCSKSTLLRHKRMHSGNPWYVCQFCGKFFFRKDVYIRHENNVHKNSSKNMFCCYYCKLCFSETVTLKEHVEAVHKKSAFLPIKHNVSDKDEEDSPVKKRIVIKQEKDTAVADEVKTKISSEIKADPTLKSESRNENNSKFKCSECFERFENVSSIEIHMQTHTKVSLDSKTNESSESVNDCDSQKHTTAINERSVLSESTSKTNKFNKMEEKLESPPKLSAALPEKNIDNFNEIDKVSCNELPDVDKLDSETSVGASELPRPLNCKLCLKHFSTKKLLAEHSNIVHKIVDWYQCLVCSAYGPKREMLEHMLTHMYKVGSFVIAETEDYEAAIVSSLENDKQNKSAKKSTEFSLKKQTTDSPKDVSLVSDDELPPLKEFGLCSCFDSEFEQKKEICATSSSIEYNVDQSKDVETLKCFETPLDFSEKNNFDQSKDVETLECFETPLDFSEKNNFDQNKDVETLKCFETPIDFSEKNNQRKISLDESLNLSVENTSTSLSVQNTNNPCGNNFKEEEVSKDEETAEDNKVLKIEDDTETSSPVKSDFAPDLKSVENSLDYNQTENFSQLRYLLQSPNSKSSVENKTPLFSFPQLQNPSVTFGKQNTSVKASNQDSCNVDATNLVSKNDSNFTSLDLSSKTSIDFMAPNLLPKSDISLIPPKQNFNSIESRDKTCIAQENNQSSNTCLKFDVNQSRCEFSENVNYAKNLNTSNQKNQNFAEGEKNENFFKTCPTPNAILDFSDLIQHSFGNSSPSEDIFSFSLPKQVDSSLNMGMREEVRTPDCSDMMNYDSSEYSLKCQKCNVLLLDHIDKLNHKCSSVQPEQSIDIDLFSHYKPKNAFYSLPSAENQNKNVSLDSVTEKRGKILSPEKTANIFVCSICTKAVSSETELARHHKTDHAQNLQISPHTCECTKCHRTFPDIGELMKHSLTCLRTLFLKSPSVINDCLNPPGSLQSFIKKEEPKTNFSVNTSLTFNSIPTDFSRQTSENLLKRSFNS